jgi:hypothetical protein
VGEPLPPGAPTDPYELSAWCYGALDEYLKIYEQVKPDLRDIDKLFGTSVVETDPYQHDMAAYRVELKMIGDSVTDAEKASPRPISQRGVSSMRLGRSIWSIAETKPSRELARAWLTWGLPDKCDSNARELTQRSLLLGQALGYNAKPPESPPAPVAATPDFTPTSPAADAGHKNPAPEQPAASTTPATAPGAPPADQTTAPPPPAPAASEPGAGHE